MHSQDSGPSSCGDEAPGGRAADPHAADLTAVGQEARQCHTVSNAVFTLTEKRPLPSAPSLRPLGAARTASGRSQACVTAL